MHTFKITSFILVLLLVMLLAGLYSVDYLKQSSNEIVKQMASIEQTIKKADWKGAQNSLLTSKGNWNNISGMWATLIDHIEIDHIDISFSKIEKYIEAKDSSMALAEASLISQLIRHIPEKEGFNLKNIF